MRYDTQNAGLYPSLTAKTIIAVMAAAITLGSCAHRTESFIKAPHHAETRG